ILAAAQWMGQTARQRQRQARAETLVQGLAIAETAGVPRLLEELTDVRDLARPNLTELAAGPIDQKPGLNARLALLADEPSRASELAAYLPDCRAEELPTIRQLLLPHAEVVAPLLWEVLLNERAPRGRAVRAACALAGLTPRDPRWPAVAPAVVAGVVR